MKKNLISLLALCLLSLTANAQLLWKITGNGLDKPSYLLGTYHLAKTSFVDSISGLKPAMEACEQVVGELDMAALASNPTEIQAMQQAMMLPGDSTLADLLKTEDYTRLDAFMKENMGAGFDNPMMAQVKKLKPAAMTTQITLLLCLKADPGVNPMEPFDTYFQQYAVEHEKQVRGLETMAYQSDILYGAPLQRQASLLMCMVDNVDYQTDLLKRIATAFYAQDLAGIDRVMTEKQNNGCDSTPEEDAQLIYTRNADWAEKLPAFMKDKSTLITVGCGHLPGQKGLISLLKEKGYSLTPIQ